MSDVVYCSEQVYGTAWGGSRCSRKMKVMRNGKPYCGQHDPEKVTAVRAAAEAKYQAKKAAQEQVRLSAAKLADQLGVGKPDYFGCYTGGIVLTAEEAQRLIARLERMRG